MLGLPPGEAPGLDARHVHQNPLAQPVGPDRRVRSRLVFSNAAHCYLKPTALDVPDIEMDRLETPSPFTPLGANGVGEGGAIPGPAAVANAVEDALAGVG